MSIPIRRALAGFLFVAALVLSSLAGTTPALASTSRHVSIRTSTVADGSRSRRSSATYPSASKVSGAPLRSASPSRRNSTSAR